MAVFITLRDHFNQVPNAWRISSTSAWRPSCFLENTSSPFTRTSKTPPLDGMSVQEAICPSNSLSNSSVNLTARGRYPQTAQYSISTRSTGASVVNAEIFGLSGLPRAAHPAQNP